MKRFSVYCAAALLCGAVAGCQAPFPNQRGAYGATVRATLASQVVAPTAHADQGSDGTAATAAYVNYQHSYVTPVPHSDSPSFGTK